jgi:hypothetical protein
MRNNSQIIDFNNETQYVEFLKFYVDSYYDKLEILFEKVLDKNLNINKNKETIFKLLVTIYLINKF